MSLLLDTNVLLRLAHTSSRDHATVEAAVLALAEADVELCLVPQVLYEFWVVATRPLEVNGLGMDVAGVERSLQMLLSNFSLRRDERGIFSRWQTLVTTHTVQGKLAHDARLVAAMQRHGVTDLLTFNTADFHRFTGIRVYSPAEILAGHLPV